MRKWRKGRSISPRYSIRSLHGVFLLFLCFVIAFLRATWAPPTSFFSPFPFLSEASLQGQLGLGTYNDAVFTITAIPFYATLPITSVSVGENAHFASTGTSFSLFLFTKIILHLCFLSTSLLKWATSKSIPMCNIFLVGSSYYSCGSNSDGQLGQGQGATVATVSTPTLMALTGNNTIFALPKATIAYSRMISMNYEVVHV